MKSKAKHVGEKRAASKARKPAPLKVVWRGKQANIGKREAKKNSANENWWRKPPKQTAVKQKLISRLKSVEQAILAKKCKRKSANVSDVTCAVAVVRRLHASRQLQHPTLVARSKHTNKETCCCWLLGYCG